VGGRAAIATLCPPLIVLVAPFGSLAGFGRGRLAESQPVESCERRERERERASLAKCWQWQPQSHLSHGRWMLLDSGAASGRREIRELRPDYARLRARNQADRPNRISTLPGRKLAFASAGRGARFVHKSWSVALPSPLLKTQLCPILTTLSPRTQTRDAGQAPNERTLFADERPRTLIIIMVAWRPKINKRPSRLAKVGRRCLCSLNALTPRGIPLRNFVAARNHLRRGKPL